MALRLEAGWNTAVVGTMSLEVDEGGGVETVSLPAGTYCHTDLSGSITGYSDAATAWQTALNAAGGLAETYTVTYSASTMSYTVSATGAFSLGYTSTAAQLAMNSLGFGAAQSSASSHSSTVRPYYVISAAMGAASSVEGPKERAGITEEAEADDGTAFGESVAVAGKRYDFELVMEEKTAVFIEDAVAAVPWTYEHFFQHVRMEEPFYFDDGITPRILQLRAPATSHEPRRVQQDFDGLWDHGFATRILATP